jgi:NhaP-type Na+/H+ or K+/H+ antiporter
MTNCFKTIRRNLFIISFVHNRNRFVTPKGPMENYLLQIMVIGLAGFMAQWFAWKAKVPAIVFLLLTGFVFGPLLHIVRPHELLGGLMRPAIAVAVSIILFEASLSLNIREIREFQRSVKHIVLIGGPVAWLLTSILAHFVAGLSWPTAITFGGLLIVTGPTVIIPLLRSARLSPRIGSILKWEGIINDPLGVLYAILAYEYFSYAHAHSGVGPSFYLYFAGLLAGVALASIVFGYIAAFILERGYVPEYLKSYFLFIAVIALFCACNILMDEAGLMAVAIFGITIGTRHVSSLEDIKRFKETVTLLLVSGVFILLTASLDPSVLLQINARGALFILLLLFIIRPLSVWLSSLGTKLPKKETIMIGWLAPRGVVCASLAGVMGPQLVHAGFADGDRLLPLAFAIVIITCVLHSFSVKPLGVRLGLAATEAGGLIIVGASPWAIQLAETLKEKNIPVLVADNNWQRLKAARLGNLPVYYGEVLSEEAAFAIDHSGYGGLLAATDNSAYNALVCNTYAPDFGRERVWQVANIEETGAADRKKVSHARQGKVFADTTLDFEALSSMFAQGLRFKATKVGPQSADADEAGLLSGAEDIKTGFLRNGTLHFRSPGLDSPAKEGDILLWIGRPKMAAA